jgi:hypothetical protein
VPGTLASSLTIERVIILGLQADRHYTATASPGGARYAARSGVGVDARVPSGSGVVVRTLGLPLAHDWSLKVLEGKGTATV